MPTYSFFVYNTGGLDFSGGNVTLSDTFDADDDRWIVNLTDDDNQLDGDFSNDERGYDSNQRAGVYESDGTTLADLNGQSYTNGRIYAEEQYQLTGDDGSLITVYLLEIRGRFAGYLPTAPLDPDVTYSYSTENVIGNDEVAGSFWNFFYGGTDATDPTPYTDPSGGSLIQGAVVLCFTAETKVITPLGRIPLSDVRVGMQIKTKDSGFQTVRWISNRHLSGAELQEKPELAPIVIEQDAFGDGQPNCQTRLSPQHRVYVKSPLNQFFFGTEETLAPAKGLLNGTTVWQEIDSDGVDYVHVLFDRHEILKADGLYSESFHPGDWSVAGLTAPARAELYEIFPELAGTAAAYGPAAYPSLSVKEAKLLVA